MSRQEEEREEARNRRGREELFQESIHAQLENLAEKPKKKKRRSVSFLAILVAGGMVLATLLRFLLGL